MKTYSALAKGRRYLGRCEYGVRDGDLACVMVQRLLFNAINSIWRCGRMLVQFHDADAE